MAMSALTERCVSPRKNLLVQYIRLAVVWTLNTPRLADLHRTRVAVTLARQDVIQVLKCRLPMLVGRPCAVRKDERECIWGV